MPVVTISRQFGSGGRSLGEKICNLLNYALYDNELIQMVADQARVSIESVGSIEKDSSGIFKRFIAGIVPKSLSDVILERKGQEIQEEIYVDLLQKIITEIASHGNAVIIGRASQYILENEKDVYHVLVRANKEDRIKFLEKKYHLSRHQAQRAIDMEDKRRANLYRKFGKMDYDDPIRYHLVINTSKVDIEDGSKLVGKMLNRSS